MTGTKEEDRWLYAYVPVMERGDADKESTGKMSRRWGQIEPTKQWCIYRFDPATAPEHWSLGHVVSGLVLNAKPLTKGRAKRLGWLLAENVFDVYPTSGFKRDVIRVTENFDPEILPEYLRGIKWKP